MNTQLVIKNFRIFGSEGASVGFKPITILTGCNSSGKSSIVKTLFILKEFVRKASDDLIRTGKYKPSQYNVDFTLPELKLKSFSSAVNLSEKDKPIVISYTAKSLCFDYKVELSFRPKESDVFDSAWLSSMAIYSPDGSEFLFAEVKGDSLTLSRLNFLNQYFYIEFLHAAFAANYLYIINKKRGCFDGDIEYVEELEKWKKEENSFIDYLDNSPIIKGKVSKALVFRFLDILDYPEFGKEYPSLYVEKNKYFKGLDKLIDKNILFYFPVLEELSKLPNQEVRTALANIQFDPFFSHDLPIADWSKKIADDFENSSYDNFMDYYRGLENRELSNIIQSKSLFANATDFFDDVKTVSAIYYFPEGRMLKTETPEGNPSFGMLYEFLSCWSLSGGPGDQSEIIQVTPMSGTASISHLLYDAMLDYLKMMLKNVLYPNFVSRLLYMGNFQSNVKRLFSFDDKSNNLCNTIHDYLELKRNLESLHKDEAWFLKMSKRTVYSPSAFMNKWVKKLGIGTQVIIKEVEDGLGAKVLIKKKKEDDKKIAKKRDSWVTMPLADEGYGITQVITFLLHIENEILRNKLKDDRLTIQQNYTETYLDGTPVSKNKVKATLAIEEPEVSLHPSFQSQLAEIFYDAFKSYGIEFIIETHSEYLIRRTQAIVAKMSSTEEYKKRPFAVYYVDKGGQTYELRYLESGRFENSFGPGFFDEASRSSIEILKREKRMK